MGEKIAFESSLPITLVSLGDSVHERDEEFETVSYEDFEYVENQCHLCELQLRNQDALYYQACHSISFFKNVGFLKH